MGRKPVDINDPEQMEAFRKRSEERAKKRRERNYESEEPLGIASGSEDLLDKSDADLFPGEIEEYTPEERRERLIKEVKKDDKD